MMDKLKQKSYALLMAYDLHKLIEQNTDSLKEYLKKESDPSNEQILLHLNEIGTTPIDIYSWSPDWDELCRTLNLMVKPLFRISLIESNTMLLLINKWQIEPVNIDLKTLSNRIVFVITKYINLKWLFHIIYENYKDLKKYHSDIEIGTEKFNEIILKKINSGGTALSSERTHAEIKRYFNDSKKNKTSTYEFILNNFPFDLLTEISTSNENKISLFFQRGLAREMLFYLNLTKMPITQKQYFLGFSFFLSGFIYNKDEFIKKKLAKDKYYEFAPSDYEEFLRTEGYNICKSL
jgi:hypothetical protein